jgi:hypothetical protein
MKTPEERLSRGKGIYINCTDYDDAIKVIKEYAIEYYDQFKQQTENNILKLIKKYESILVIIESNYNAKQPDDHYPYLIDIKNTKEFIKDLKSLITKTK